MAEPWEIMPPTHWGDEDPNVTYAAVGRALSAWEELESTLAVLFGLLSKKDPIDSLNDRKGNTFGVRMREVIDAFGQFRIFDPDQTLEGDFLALMDEVLKIAERRHDIAHGMVQKRTEMSPPGEFFTRIDLYMLGPPWYQDTKFKRFKVGGFTQTLPTPEYLFTASDIDQYGDHFRSYAQKIYKMSERVYQKQQPLEN